MGKLIDYSPNGNKRWNIPDDVSWWSISWFATVWHSKSSDDGKKVFQQARHGSGRCELFGWLVLWRCIGIIVTGRRRRIDNRQDFHKDVKHTMLWWWLLWCVDREREIEWRAIMVQLDIRLAASPLGWQLWRQRWLAHAGLQCSNASRLRRSATTNRTADGQIGNLVHHIVKSNFYIAICNVTLKWPIGGELGIVCYTRLK